MNNCFSYSFIKCGEPASGVTTLDAVFNTLSKLDLYGMFDDPQGAINRATELAYKSMSTALLSKEGKTLDQHNIIYGDRFIDTYSTIQKSEFSSKSKKFIRINKVWINVNYSGIVNVSLKNELASIQLMPVAVVAGITKELIIDKDYRYVEVTINENIQGRTTYVSGTNGLLIDYSVLCDYNIFICSNKNLFQTCMDYKVASILLTDGQFSGQINQRLMQSEDYDLLKKEYEIEYERELDKLSIKDSGCFDCPTKMKFKSWING